MNYLIIPCISVIAFDKISIIISKYFILDVSDNTRWFFIHSIMYLAIAICALPDIYILINDLTNIYKYNSRFGDNIIY